MKKRVRSGKDQTLFEFYSQVDAVTSVKGLRFGNGTYSGQMVRGQPHGQGTLVGDTHVVLQGQWVSGLLDGLATFLAPGPLVFKGAWSHGRPHGLGFLWKQGPPAPNNVFVVAGVAWGVDEELSAAGIWNTGNLTHGTLLKMVGNGVAVETHEEGAVVHSKLQCEGMPAIKHYGGAPVTGIPQVLPTAHGGWHFRSRLEARWAVFMTVLKVPFVYEIHAFDVDYSNQELKQSFAPPRTQGSARAGGRRQHYYTPDYWLPAQGGRGGIFLEIKGAYPTVLEVTKAAKLAEITRSPVYVFFGPMGKPFVSRVNSGVKAMAFLPNQTGPPTQLEPFAWVECPLCHALDITLRGQPACGTCPDGDTASYASGAYSLYFSRLERAYAAARSFNFDE